MNVLSLFNGMSIGRESLKKANIKVDRYYSSEIKEEAIKVTDFNYPGDIENKLGDVCNIDCTKLPKIDLLIGGSPCQDLSIAMKDRTGLEGLKSKLFYEYIRIKEETNPTYFLLENVGSMRKSDRDIISEIMGVQPIMIDAQLVSAQLRKRYYWTNIQGVTQPKDKEVLLQDIIQCGYTDRKKARCILESESRPLTTPIKMFHRYYSTGFTTLIFKDKKHYEECIKHYNSWFKGLSAKQIDEAMIYTGIDLKIYDGVRYLNQNELEELQCVQKGYTNILTRNEAAGLLGDGWNVDVIAHILKGLKEEI